MGLRALALHLSWKFVGLQAFSHVAVAATPTAIKRTFRHVPYVVVELIYF